MDINRYLISALSKGIPPIELMIHELRSTRSNDRIAYYVYPKVNSSSLGSLFPSDYEAATSSNAVGHFLCEWTLAHLVEPMQAAIDSGSDFAFIAVDVTLGALTNERVLVRLAELETRIPYELRGGICFTFPADTLFHDHEAALGTLEELREKGYMIGLRGYGTDYCPALRLAELPMDVVFLDKSLKSKLNSDTPIYKTLIDFVNTLECMTVLCGEDDDDTTKAIGYDCGCDVYMSCHPTERIE